MKFIKVILILGMAFWVQDSYAQRYQLSDSVEVFGEDVYEMMRATNDSTAVQVGRQFSGMWYAEKLNAAQKDSIMQLSQQMLQRNLKPKPYFENLYAIISYAIDSADISTQNLNDLLAVTRKSLTYYDRYQMALFLRTLRDFFSKSSLYHASFNQLLATEGKYSFEFIAPQEENLLPIEEETEAPAEEESWEVEEDDGGWGDPDATDDWGNLEEDDGWNEGWGDDTWEDTEEPEAAVAEEEKADVMDYLIQEPVQPEVTGAVMRFEDVTFTFLTTFDSANLHKTSGALMLKDGIFVGEGGKFDWATAGYDEDSVFCTLGKYNFDIRIPKLSAENTTMTFLGMVKEPVEGIFQFASQNHNGYMNARYPRFKSYKSDVEVKVFDGKSTGGNKIIYKGGFALQGRNFSSESVLDGMATLKVQDEAFEKFKAVAKRFTFNDSLVNANRAAVTIYHKLDSIHHPDVNMRYYADSSELVVRLLDGEAKKTPFTSSYFKMDVRGDIIRWNLRGDSLNISTISARNHVPVIFESHEYFNEERFDKLSQMYDFHPLIMAIGYARKTKQRSFYLEDLAKATRQNDKIVHAAMKDLKERGLIDYNEGTREVTINEKGLHSVLSKGKKKDYDNLLIPSVEASLPNAVFDMENQEMKVRGIDKFYISKELNVYIIPDNQELTLLSNRDFRFDGNLFSGNFEFKGRDFTFDYQNFLVDLQEIDSIRFYLTDEEGNRKRVDNSLVSASQDSAFVASNEESIQQTSGTLFINEPNNKSARKFNPAYPKFDAMNGAVIYFDGQEVLDGAYDKTVYFVVPPFAIDSLSDTDPAAIGFEGTLYSGIFPPIDETLRVMGDNSMGFQHKVPSGGYELYKGSGKYYNELTMDSRGLRGNGYIEFLTSTLESQDFVFYMDSATTVGTYAEIREGVLGPASFPQAYVEDYTLKWLPQKDSMYIINNDKPFEFYNQTASMDGAAILTRQGLLGNGTLFTRGSEAQSEEMTFEQSKFNARHAEFEIKSDDPKKPALTGDDVRLDFDLNEEKALISPEVEGVAAIDFPYAQFKTSITQAEWDLMEETVRMSKPADVPIESSYFYATRKDLDSLAFNAEEAVYQIQLQQLDISGVPFIKVADAKVIPENNQVQVLANAKLHTFNNAQLVLDTLNEYHNLSEGTIDIINRNKFTGTATYQFATAEEDTFAIAMSGFRKEYREMGRRDSAAYTIAEGKVEQEQNLTISPGMVYRGKVKMAAYKPALTLDGYVKLDFKKIPDYNTWIRYESDAEQQQIVFDFENALTERGASLTAGLHLDNRTNELYATFVTPPHSIGDFEVFRPKGALSYNEEADQYEIKKAEKAQGNSYAGEAFTYNENTNEITFEGPIHLIEGSDPGMQLEASAIGKGNLDSSRFVLDAFLMMDFDIPDQAARLMAEDLNKAADQAGAPPATQDRTALLYKAAEFIGNETVNEYSKRSVANYTPLVSMTGRLEHTLVFADVDFVWSPENKAWYSTSPLGLSNILDVDINARLNGFMEIKRGDYGSTVNIFMQASPGSWYFLSYQNARLMMWGYNEDFNDIVITKSNIAKADSDEFAFYEGDIAETLSFVNRFRQTYLDIREPYRFDDAPQLVAGDEEVTEEEKKEETADGF